MGLSQTRTIMDINDNYSWDKIPDTIRIQHRYGRSNKKHRIVLRYEYYRRLVSTTSGKTQYFIVTLASELLAESDLDEDEVVLLYISGGSSSSPRKRVHV